MAGIMLTPERFRDAPPQVREWLEREIARSTRDRPSPAAAPPHIVPINPATAQALLMRVAGVLPVANLLFELARGGSPTASEEIDAAPLADLILHARFDSAARISRSIALLNRIAQDVLNDPAALLCDVDAHGSYFIAVETRRSLGSLWQNLVADLDDIPAMGDGQSPDLLSENGVIRAAVRPHSFAWSIPSQSDTEHNDRQTI